MYRSLLAEANGTKDASREDSRSSSDDPQQNLRDEVRKMSQKLESARKLESDLKDQLKAAQKKVSEQEKVSQKQLDDLRAAMEKTR